MIIRRCVVALAIVSLIFLACSNTNPVPASTAKKVVSTFKYNSLDKNKKEYYYQQLAPLYSQLLVNSGFNGAVVVAKNGEIVFEDYLGFINAQTKEYINSDSKFHIASVSKTFTAMAVLQLMELGKIDINADVTKYLTNFPYLGISVKNLLSHRSGLANYLYFMDGRIAEAVTTKNRRGKLITRTVYKPDSSLKNGLLNNNDVLNYIVSHKPPIEAFPNTRFRYCNTNYVLLALIVEKVTGIDFPAYMKKTIFDPLGMKNTYVFSQKDTVNYVPSYKGNYRPYRLERHDCVYGDKNVYSTPRDLLLWDKALYNNSIVKKETLELAITPLSFEKAGKHNYGLGWRLITTDNGMNIPYHNGWWHGNNAVFTRLLSDTATIIVLGNKYNTNIYKAKRVLNVFSPAEDSLQKEFDDSFMMPEAQSTGTE